MFLFFFLCLSSDTFVRKLLKVRQGPDTEHETLIKAHDAFILTGLLVGVLDLIFYFISKKQMFPVFI